MEQPTFVATTSFEKMLVTQIYRGKITYKEGKILIFVFKGLIKNSASINKKEIREKLGITRGYLRIILRKLIKKNWISHNNKKYYISNKTRGLYSCYLSNCLLLPVTK